MKIYGIDDIENLLELEPEELGYNLIVTIQNKYADRNFTSNDFVRNIVEGYTTLHSQKEEATLIIMETFCWLEAQTLIIRDPKESGNNGWRVLSKRARNIREEKNYKDYIDVRYLRKDILHPALHSVWGTLIRGLYDTAVFQAMREVEIAVRKAAELPAECVGVPLMRKAFAENKDGAKVGRLTDSESPIAEQQAVANLFAGSIGYYKNPGSHRKTNVDDPLTAIEVIMLANRLLKIVDVRKSEMKFFDSQVASPKG